MSATLLTRESASALISEIFVYHMPFNRALGLELQRFEADYAELVLIPKKCWSAMPIRKFCTVVLSHRYWMFVQAWCAWVQPFCAMMKLRRKSCWHDCLKWAQSICEWTICAPAVVNVLWLAVAAQSG